MSEILMRLPQTLHNQLELLAGEEGVSLDQYILYSLTNQVANAYTIQRLPAEEVEKQVKDFAALRARWRKATSHKSVDQILAEREIGEPEPDLTPELVAKVRARIAETRQMQQTTRIKETIY